MGGERRMAVYSNANNICRTTLLRKILIKFCKNSIGKGSMKIYRIMAGFSTNHLCRINSMEYICLEFY